MFFCFFFSVSLNSWRGHRICYKRGGWSTVERIENMDENLAQCTSGVVCQLAHESQDPVHTICAPSQDECPIVAIGGISHISSLNHDVVIQKQFINASSPQNWRPIIEFQPTIGSPCWKGTFGQKGRSNNIRVADKYNTNCKVDDDRFQFWDEINEPDLYNENNVPVSGHLTLGDNSVTEYQFFNPSSDVNWSISYRPEIFWKSDCKVGSVRELSIHLTPLKYLTSLEQTLVILNGIFGEILKLDVYAKNNRFSTASINVDCTFFVAPTKQL